MIISIHAPREGSDLYIYAGEDLPEGISIHAPREGSDDDLHPSGLGGTSISIHAPREGSDRLVGVKKKVDDYISIHAPREGSDQAVPHRHRGHEAFQSTLPARGATCTISHGSFKITYFNPRSPRGERPKAVNDANTAWAISIHAPREGSDAVLPAAAMAEILFQSTLPARGATLHKSWMVQQSGHFNPRSPRGERPRHTYYTTGTKKFQSTLPARGATGRTKPRDKFVKISIHAPREGSDESVCRGKDHTRHFNPRSPRGERHYGRHRGKRVGYISIHAPREGSDRLLHNLA